MEDKMKVLDDMEELVIKELKKIETKGDLTPVELKNAMDAVCLLEKLKKVQMREWEEEEEGYSENYPMRGSYRRGRSARTGRYVSMDRGYSGHSIKDRVIDKLEHMMNEADSEYEREKIAAYLGMVEAN